MGMGFHGLRSMSGRTILFVVLAAAYYLVLNAVLINELIERVHMTPPPVAARSAFPLETPDPRDPAASCTKLAKRDRDICKAELLVGEASARLKERTLQERRERRDRRALPAPPPLTGALHRESAATAR